MKRSEAAMRSPYTNPDSKKPLRELLMTPPMTAAQHRTIMQARVEARRKIEERKEQKRLQQQEPYAH